MYEHCPPPPSYRGGYATVNNGRIDTSDEMTRVDELGQRKDSSSDNWFVYKRGQAQGSSVQTNVLAWFV